MKQRIHLTEGQLNRIIKESVKNILNEIGDTPKGQFALGAVRGRALARPMYQNDKYNGVYSRAKQHQIAGQAADKSWENSKDLDINKRKEMTDSEGRGYYYGFKKGMNENVKNKIPNPMGGPEDRINAYPEYAQDWYSEEPMDSIPNKHRLHTLDRTTDSYGDWYRDDHAYCDDGDLYPSAAWCNSYRSPFPSKDYRWLDDADKELEKMQHKRIKNDLDNKWKTQQDRNKYNKQADSRPLHRKGSLNREF